ncbi:MAG: cytochrome c3 family protein [Syntrophotaleaceae bacterium]
MMRRVFFIALSAFFIFCLLAITAWALLRSRVQEKPEQPVAFPHTVHAGRLGLACDFCHESVAVSRHAGVPPLSKCMSCHETIATDQPEIIKLKQYYERKEAIHWVRIHALPDFIYFTHKRHVKAGVSCAACHGGVEQMVEIQQVRSLKMGWCVTCHRTQGAPWDCSTCHQ